MPMGRRQRLFAIFKIAIGAFCASASSQNGFNRSRD
jgi:hypothetical protein